MADHRYGQLSANRCDGLQKSRGSHRAKKKPGLRLGRFRAFLPPHYQCLNVREVYIDTARER